jgi:2,3-bisphosphoglycerate-dependent phosphoglycerate mutase
VATVLLVRHGRTAANSGGILAGRTPGVHLDDAGTAQAAAVGERVAALPIRSLVSSPLDRCVETAQAIAAALKTPPDLVVDEGLIECGYGTWTGQQLKTLSKEPLWKVVQRHPSAAEFPDGESIAGMQRRALDTVRRHDRAITDAHGPHALWLAVSHADVIKSILADACGMHLDQFQRIMVDPASISVVMYTPERPFVVRVNDVGDLGSLAPPKRRRTRRASGEAVVGGGAGSP